MVDKEGNIFEDDYTGRERKFRIKCKTNTKLSKNEMRRFLSFSCVLPNLSAALIKRNLYEKIGGLSEKYLVASDWAFWLSLSEVTDFYYISEPLNNFRQHETTIRSRIKSERQILEIFSIFYEHINQYSLDAKNRIQMKIGFGFVWFSFLFMGSVAWFKCFSKVLAKSFSIEKFSIVFLMLGVFVYSREVLYNRFK